MDRCGISDIILKKWRVEAGKAARSASVTVEKHGLGVSFDPKTVKFPPDAATPGYRPPKVRVVGAAEVMELSEALGDERLRPQIAAVWSASDFFDKAEAWLESGASGGTVIILPRDDDASVFIDAELDQAVRTGRIIIIAPPGSRGTVVERVFGRRSGWSGSTVRAAVGAGARLTHVSLHDLPPTAVDLAWRRASVARDGEMNWFEGCFGSDLARSHVVTDLAGRGASVRQRTMFIGGGRDRFDLSAFVRHGAEATVSDIAARGVLLGSARANWRGLIRIPPGLKGCQGSEKSDILLLSPGAEIGSQPEVEVDSEDVRCHHASTVGRLDREKLFYLMSRGLDRPQAARQMTEGFLSPVMSALSGSDLEETVRCLIGHKFADLP